MPTTRKRKSTGGSAQKRKVARKSPARRTPARKTPSRSTRRTPAKAKAKTPRSKTPASKKKPTKKARTTSKPSRVEKQWWDSRPASKSSRPTRVMKEWWDTRPKTLSKSSWWDKRQKGTGEWWDVRPVRTSRRTRGKASSVDGLSSPPKVTKKKIKKKKKKAGAPWWDQRDEASGSLALLFKFNAAFLGFFALQLLVCPQFLLDTNFKSSPKMDAYHYFVARGLGMVMLFFVAITVMVDPVKFLPTMTAASVLFSATVPWYAQAYMSVKTEHYLPFAGTVVLAGWHVYEYMKS